MKFQSQAFEVERFRVREGAEEKWDPASVQSGVRDEAPRVELQVGQKGVGSAIE